MNKSVTKENVVTLPAIEAGVIRTYTGKMINVFDPDPELICIEDIAHALGNLCRFGGHTRKFYSVAEHSVLVASKVRGPLKLTALLHDAAEAYLVDLPSPIKYFIPNYQDYEQNLMLTIAEKFNINFPLPMEVVNADREALEEEWGMLMDSNENAVCFPFNPGDARGIFLSRFNQFNKK